MKIKRYFLVLILILIGVFLFGLCFAFAGFFLRMTGFVSYNELNESHICEANTYYIDYVNGNDSNAGNCTDAAWKYVPQDSNFTGTHTVRPGEIFTFKGGATYFGLGSGTLITSDRVLNWSNAGIVGGIPNRTTICANLSASPINAQTTFGNITNGSNLLYVNSAIDFEVGQGINVVNASFIPWTTTPNNLLTYIVGINGNILTLGANASRDINSTLVSHDDTGLIQRAISNCSSNQVIYLQAGIYKISDSLTLKNGTVLRGEGPTKTVLQSTPVNTLITTTATVYNGIIVVSGYTKGSTTLVLANSSPISAGDYVVLTQENDNTTTTVSNQGEGGNSTWGTMIRCSSNHSIVSTCYSHGTSCDNGNGVCEGGTRTVGQVLKVISKNGNNISFEDGLNWNYSSNADPQIFKFSLMNKYVGVEDLKIAFNTSDVDALGTGIKMYYCAYCWAKNIEVSHSPRIDIDSYGSYHNEYRDSYFHDTYVNNSLPNHGYGFELEYYTTGSLIENNILYRKEAPFLFVYGSSGNVFGYNYVGLPSYYAPNWLGYGMGTHGAHPYMNLFEGNNARNMILDDFWGSASHHTIFRNRIYGDGESYYNNTAINMGRWAITLESDITYSNILGNVLGADNFSGVYQMNDSGCSLSTPAIYRFGYPGSNCNTFTSDQEVITTTLIDGNYDYYHNEVIWDANISNHSLPNSYYLTSRPSWWSSDLAWPPYGPDTNFTINKIPAEVRFLVLTEAIDSIYPIFSSYYSNNGTLNNSGIGLFNVSVVNANGTVWLEINHTNISATNLSANVFNASYNFVANGTYSYNWYAYGNGTSKLLNNSEIKYYTINYSAGSTCSDAIQNGDETGTDCGGSCNACAVVVNGGNGGGGGGANAVVKVNNTNSTNAPSNLNENVNNQEAFNAPSETNQLADKQQSSEVSKFNPNIFQKLLNIFQSNRLIFSLILIFMVFTIFFFIYHEINTKRLEKLAYQKLQVEQLNKLKDMFSNP